ncbi:MauE/DoxX family redox-associated membrane protein [Streptomyces sp. H39-S7]|uniref:MauE/DoxX family redox-associated membrane protein n=1 Tax=Streptomyces sp. H39-S7 TaxID=3004357 RepID=UPI002F35BA0D
MVAWVVYTAMALGQLVSFGRMPGILTAYGPANGAGATTLAVVLIAGELVRGVWFLARPRSTARTPVCIYTAASVTWTAMAVQAYARGLAVVNCGCFGGHLSQPLPWIVLVQDALTIQRGRRRRPDPVVACGVRGLRGRISRSQGQ